MFKFKTAAIVLCAFAIGLALTACGKKIAGEYADDGGRVLRLLPGGNWTMSNGMAGQYKVDGDTLILSGLAGGQSISGTFDGETLISLSDRDMMTGNVRQVRFYKTDAPRDPNGQSSRANPSGAEPIRSNEPATPAVSALSDVKDCAKLQVDERSTEREKDYIKRFLFLSLVNKPSSSVSLSPLPKSSWDVQMQAKSALDRLPGVGAAYCSAWPNPNEIFCHASAATYKVSELTDGTAFVLSKNNAGWTCRYVSIALDSNRTFFRASDTEIDEASRSTGTDRMKGSNPFAVWGNKNRCLWDERFAVTDPSCKKI